MDPTIVSSFHSPEAAITATIIVVRLALVILICVLLVKLVAPSTGRSSGNSTNYNNYNNIYRSNSNDYFIGNKQRRRRRTKSGSIVFVSIQNDCESHGACCASIKPEAGGCARTNDNCYTTAKANAFGYTPARDDSDSVDGYTTGGRANQDSDYYSDTSSNQDGSSTPTKLDSGLERVTLFDSSLFSSLISRYQAATGGGQQGGQSAPTRRKSQPELMRRQSTTSTIDVVPSSTSSQSFKGSSIYSQKRNNFTCANNERARRHSDTSLDHLKLPPGPMGLPFLGYLPFVGPDIHLTLTSLGERYGPIYQIFLGGIRVVVLNDASLVRQAFKQPVFSGRPDTQLTRILQGYGIVNSDGALWKEQRAFLHSALRKLGAKSIMSGTNGLEAKIQNQVKEFVSDLSSHASEGRPCQMRPIVARAVSSVVGSIVMNSTYRKYEEKEKFDRLIELMHEGFRLFTIAMPLDFIPIFRFFPGVSYAYKKMKKNRAETSAFFKGVADEHRRYLRDTFNLGTSSSTSSLHPRNQASTDSAYGTPTSSHSTATSAISDSCLAASSGGKLMSSECSIAGAAPALASMNITEALSVGSEATKAKVTVASSAEAQSGAQITVLGQPSASLRSVDAPTRISLNYATLQGKLQDGGSLSQASGEKLQAPPSSQIASHTEQSQQQQQQQQQQQPPSSQAQPKQTVELENIVTRDLVDAYIVQQIKHEKDGKENYFSDQQLVQIMSDIFSAGLETVTSMIEWSILFLILNTECQDQIQEEIDQVIGRDRMPQLDDLAQMPYTEATIYEVLRRSNVVALGNAHATLADASIGGFRIPKGTQVLPNLYGIHMNPKLWNEPDKFNPSRFILNNKAHKPEYFMPFSVGRRMCLGDVLAKMEIFLFLVGLLQKYDLSVAEEDRLCPPQVKGTLGVSNAPASFRVSIKCRQN